MTLPHNNNKTCDCMNRLILVGLTNDNIGHVVSVVQ